MGLILTLKCFFGVHHLRVIGFNTETDGSMRVACSSPYCDFEGFVLEKDIPEVTDWILKGWRQAKGGFQGVKVHRR